MANSNMDVRRMYSSPCLRESKYMDVRSRYMRCYFITRLYCTLTCIVILRWLLLFRVQLHYPIGFTVAIAIILVQVAHRGVDVLMAGVGLNPA